MSDFYIYLFEFKFIFFENNYLSLEIYVYLFMSRYMLMFNNNI